MGVSNAGTITTLTNQRRHDQRRKWRRSAWRRGGGAGVSNTGTITSLSNSGAISGGSGGSGFELTSQPRYGGAGGAGVSNAGHDHDADQQRQDQRRKRRCAWGVPAAGFGGAGGAGVSNAGTITSLTNGGAISGGNGGLGFGPTGVSGAGGAGVSTATRRDGWVAHQPGNRNDQRRKRRQQFHLDPGRRGRRGRRGRVERRDDHVPGQQRRDQRWKRRQRRRDRWRRRRGRRGDQQFGNDHDADQQRDDQRRKRRRRPTGGAGGAGLANFGTIGTYTNTGTITNGSAGADAIYSAGPQPRSDCCPTAARSTARSISSAGQGTRSTISVRSPAMSRLPAATSS